MAGDRDRNAEIVSLMPLVQGIARRMQRQLGGLTFDDLVSEGMIGAIQAVDRWNPHDDVKLTTFAGHRIRGQMIDAARSYGHLSRDHYAAVKEGEEEFFLASIDQPVSVNDRGGGETSLADLLPDDEDTIAKMIDQMAIRTVIDQLPLKHQELLTLYYYDGFTMKQIGAMRGVTESRICQLMEDAHDYAYHFLMQ